MNAKLKYYTDDSTQNILVNVLIDAATRKGDTFTDHDVEHLIETIPVLARTLSDYGFELVEKKDVSESRKNKQQDNDNSAWHLAMQIVGIDNALRVEQSMGSRFTLAERLYKRGLRHTGPDPDTYQQR